MQDFYASNGYGDVKIVMFEHGTWVNQPKGFIYQTENNQAEFLIKSFIYKTAHGIAIIDWNNLVDWNNYGGNRNSVWAYMGLIADGENGDGVAAGTPRLAYYAYKLLSEKLKGADWDNIKVIQESDGIQAYKFIKDGQPIWVAWKDNRVERKISLSGIEAKQVKITQAIPNAKSGRDLNENNYPDFFKTDIRNTKDGTVNLVIGEVPVFIETME